MRARYLGLSLVLLLTGCSSDSDAPSSGGSGGASGAPTSSGGSKASGGSTASGGATASGGSRASGGSTASSGGTSASGGSTGSGGVDVDASPECKTFCECMAKNCSDKVFPKGCLAECAEQTTWDIPCRQNMCGLVPAQPDNDHCTHAMGEVQCLDTP